MSTRPRHFIRAAVSAAVAVIALATGLLAKAASQPSLRVAKSTVLGDVPGQGGDDHCFEALIVNGKYTVHQGPNYCPPFVGDAEDDEKD
jgi:hypothetical protein